MTGAEIPDIQNMLAEAIMNVSAAMEPFLEAVEGYRLARLEEGYSEADARSMAVDYHHALLWMMTR